MSGIYIKHPADYIHSFEPYYRETEAAEIFHTAGIQTVMFHMQQGISGCFQSVPGKDSVEVYYLISGRIRIIPLDEDPFVLEKGSFFALNDRRDGTLFYVQQDTEFFCVCSQPSYQGNMEITKNIDKMLTELQQKDGDSRSHGERVRHLVMQMVGCMSRFDASKLEVLLQASRVHDVGKVKLPLSILIKATPLTEQEQAILKTHVKHSAEITGGIFQGELSEIVLHHHENYDGSGYPDGLKGDEIPVCSRLIAVAEAYDAMVITRPYHKGISSEAALRELRRCAGTQFDPDCVDALCRAIERPGCLQSDTILQKTETQLAAYEREKAKRDFLSNMSHDMRTPMNAIINLTRLAREDIEDRETLLDDLDKIEISSSFLLGLVNDILDMARIENGKIELHPTVCSYQVFMDYIESVILPLCEEKGIQFVRKMAPVCCSIYVDQVRFYQIFFNLLSNAVKYSNPGSQVLLSVEKQWIEGDLLHIDFLIEDHGIGMSREFLQKLYTPFEREDISDARMGTGLGLAITKRIINQMGGSIDIESEQGKGTKVRVHLDLILPTKQQQEENGLLLLRKQKSGEYYDLSGAHILIAEDHPLNREILVRILEKVGAVIDVVEDGEEAVARFTESKPFTYDAILMDVRMPKMDGLAATRAIRALNRPDAQCIFIAAMTAEAFEENRKETISAGMNEHLSKPIIPSDLYRTLAVGISGSVVRRGSNNQ
ncbi:MAG: response regulator [Lachnospiraceae bacterium]|nr:response regulator [Lachnospiraceae bacterium]